MKALFLVVMVITGYSTIVQAQKNPASTPILVYGDPITLQQADQIMTSAIQESTNNGWTMAVAIVDAGGNLIAFKRMDNTQVGSIAVAMGKAKTANNFKRPTKVFEDAVAAGGIGLRILSLPDVVPLEGGEPILLNGKVIGAIGVSGMSSAQDAQVARAGIAALK